MALVERTDDPGQPFGGGVAAEERAATDTGLDAVLPPSKLDEEDQLRVLKAWLRADADHSKKWRDQARDDFAFRAGEQLSSEDKARLDAQERPHVVFNRVLTILKAIAGMEINGRHEIHFKPRGTEDTAANEVLSGASKWMADTCDGEDEESQAFDHAATCGLGVVENRMSYDEDPAGLYVEECFDPREFFWDRTAKKKNMADARRMARVRKMPIGDAAAMFPGKNRQQLDATWAETAEYGAPKSIEEKRRRDSDDSSDVLYNDQFEVTLVQIQWFEREPYYLVADMQTGTKAELSEAQFRTFSSRMELLGMDVHAVRLSRKVYKQAFIGGELLQKASAAPIRGRFSWDVITGEFDAVEGIWFGLVRTMRDPAMWANKFLSQIMFILNSTAKGGILAETDAFDDQREAEEGYAMPENITWVSPGALSGGKPKIMPKPGAGTVGDYVQLMNFATAAVPQVVGINLELLGQQDMNQPGVVEAMRKQAGMTVLATLFDSLRRFRKRVGRSRLFFIQTYMSDGRLIRVSGEDGTEQAVALAKDKTAGLYDVVIDDAPTSPNQKEANWAIIQPLLAVFKDQLMANPEIFAMLMEYSPLPSRIVTAIKGFVKRAQEDPQAQQEAALTKKLGQDLIVSEIAKNQGAAQLSMAKAGTTQATAMHDIALARKMLEENNMEGVKAQLDAIEANARAKEAEANAAHTLAKAQREMAGQQSDDVHAQADLIRAHTEAQAKTVGNMIDHLTGAAQADRHAAAAHKDRVLAHVAATKPPAMGTARK